MVLCSSCNKEMDLITYPQMQIFQCVKCGFLIELPLSNKESIDYNKVIITEIPKINLSDVTLVELKKNNSNMEINQDMNLVITLETSRDLEILGKHVKRDIPRSKIDFEKLQLIIPNYELPKVFNSKIFSEELNRIILKYFKTPEFLKSYLSKLIEYLKYSSFTEEGRLLFNLPNEIITKELQRILLISKVFFIQESINGLYLPWNSVLLINSFINFPNELKDPFLKFVIKKWLPSNSFHRNISFENELRKELNTKKERNSGDLNKLSEKKSKSKPKTKSHLITDYQ
jgi:hypothetical protein